MGEAPVIEDNAISKYVQYINKNDIHFVVINDLYYKLNHVDFLKDCQSIWKIQIVSERIINFDGLYTQKSIENLQLAGAEGDIDLSVFSDLRSCGLGWSPHIKGLDHCTRLERLGLGYYKSKTKNLEELIALEALKELYITQGNISSLRGCRHFKKLEKLELNYLRNLEEIDEITALSDSLYKLVFDHCKKVREFASVSHLKELQWLLSMIAEKFRPSNSFRD